MPIIDTPIDSPPLRFRLTPEEMDVTTTGLVGKRLFFTVILLSGLAWIAFKYDAIEVLGIWIFAGILALITYTIWRVLKRHACLVTELVLDSHALYRLDSSGNTETYPWTSLIDLVPHPEIPVILKLRFRGRPPVPLGFGWEKLIPLDEHKSTSNAILTWVGVPDFFEQLPELEKSSLPEKLVFCVIALSVLVYAVLDYDPEFWRNSPAFSLALLLVSLYHLYSQACRVWRRKRLLRKCTMQH